MSTVTSPTATASSVFPSRGARQFGMLKSDVASYFGMQRDVQKMGLAGNAIQDVIDDLNRKQVYKFNIVESAAITTVANVGTIPLPSDFWKTYNARKTDDIDFTLTGMEQETFDQRYQSQANITGFPYAFVIRNTFRDGTITLFPIPDAAYTIKIRYYKLITKPTQDSDYLDIPPQYQSVVIYGARSHFAMLNEKPDLAQFWNQKFEQGYQEMKMVDDDDGSTHLRFTNVEENMGTWYMNPNSRPRAYDLW